MAKNQYSRVVDTDDTMMRLLEAGARFLLWAGLLATAVSAGFLIYYFVTFSQAGATGSVDAAKANINMFRNFLVPGVLALGVSTAFLFWGEEVLGVLQLMGAAALYFAPAYLPLIAGGSGLANPVATHAAAAIQLGGAIFGFIAIIVTFVDGLGRMQLRMKQGSKADQLKYGKGIKEEKDIQNVFMGKCWQLPYCRKFVRERCPIFHANRTCWKERVGCMCEESVINNAMSGKTIPRDAVAAAQYIPKNIKLTVEQKAERCRQCVIYNEHQKHKYKLALPTVLVGVGALYAFGKGFMGDALGSAISGADQMIGKATLQPNASLVKAAGRQEISYFKEILLVCFMLILMAYLLKLCEYLFFKLKV